MALVFVNSEDNGRSICKAARPAPPFTHRRLLRRKGRRTTAAVDPPVFATAFDGDLQGDSPKKR
jgi:hypothetical protein